jgi:hypothetical protein
MLTAADDVHKRWCPFVRVEGSNRINNSLTDGFENTPEPYHCLGDKCMMWREGQPVHLKTKFTTQPQPHGYCGLAGHLELDPGL